MIYTVTLNPAIDYVIKVDNFETGIVNRTKQENMFFGGKGINVSNVLKTLGEKSTALGFIAGFTGKAIKEGLEAKGLKTDFVEVAGLSRINVKMKSDNETEINGMGPQIKDAQVQALLGKLDNLKDGDVLVLSGSIPGSMPDDIYEKIMEYVKSKNVLILVDATNNLLMNCLKHHPFLIKPNNHELAEIFNVEIKNKEDVVVYAKKLQTMGAKNVLVSMAGDGAVLVDQNNDVHITSAPKGEVKNSVGAGDSMVAGFIYGYIKTNDFKMALKQATATGSATAFSEDLASKEKIDELLKTISEDE